MTERVTEATTEVIDLTAPRPFRRAAALWLAGWAAIILIEAFAIRTQANILFAIAVRDAIADYVPLAAASLLIPRFTNAVRRRRWPAAAVFAAHVAAAILTVTLWKGIFVLYLRWMLGPAFWQMVFADSWMYQLVNAFLTYGTMLGIIVALQAARRERQRERREAELAITAREAELAGLRAQLHPHLIMNSLNSILALVTIDPERAREMIVRLAGLLHAAFIGFDSEEVPLAIELDLVRSYLEIEQIRFAERLTVSIDADPAAASVLVPPMVLQPIVENAIKHGIGPHTRPGAVRITARRDGDRLLVEVRDTGDGAGDAALDQGGRGLSLTRRRLDSIYHSDYRLSFEKPKAGFIVRLDLPVTIDG